MKLNKILTDAEYKAQGFTTEEIPMIRKHDKLFNKYQIEANGNPWDLTEAEAKEYFDLVEKLGL